MTELSVEAKLAIHEATSASRYQHIEDRLEKGDKRMTRIEYLLYIVIGAVLLGPGFAAQLIHKLFGV
jgi:cell division protein FtsL